MSEEDNNAFEKACELFHHAMEADDCATSEAEQQATSYEESAEGNDMSGNMSADEELSEEDQVLAAFRMFDPHDTGYISEADLRYVMISAGQGLTENEVDDLIRDLDVDEDGQINYEIFLTSQGYQSDQS